MIKMPYDIKEESKEIVKEVKNSRGTIIAAIIGLVGAGLILDHFKEEGIVERIKGLFKKGDYDEEEWNVNA